jgi:membrane protease YdiL (CAAX protease family)
MPVARGRATSLWDAPATTRTATIARSISRDEVSASGSFRSSVRPVFLSIMGGLISWSNRSSLPFPPLRGGCRSSKRLEACLALPRAVEAIVPIAGLAVALPALAWFFKDTWRELDLEARGEAEELRAAGRTDSRPLVAFVMAAVVLTLQQYFGGYPFYRDSVRPVLAAWNGTHAWIRFTDFDELYGYAWWVALRVIGFVLVPLGVCRVFSSFLGSVGFGLGGRGFFRNAWMGAVFLVVALPLICIASREPDFARVYPNYRNAGRSGLDLLIWEVLYLGQFLALEIFFRGWLLRMLKGLGSGAIFALTLPYVMMHFAGKPYAETLGAIAAGIALGSLAARTKGIWLGFLVHGTVALAMDILVLVHRQEFPRRF